MLRTTKFLKKVSPSKFSVQSKNNHRSLLTNSVKYTKQTPSPNPDHALQAGIGSAIVKILGIGGTFGGLAVFGYAWYDPEFRSMVQENVPYSTETFGYVFQYFGEEEITRETKSKTTEVEKPKTLQKNVKSDKLESYQPTEEEVVSPVDSDFGKRWETTAPATALQAKVNKKDDDKRKAEEMRKRDAEMVRQKMIEKEIEEANDNSKLEEHVRVSTEVANRLVDAAINLHKEVVESTREHAAKLKQAIDDDVGIMMKDEQWNSVIEAFKQRSSKDGEAEQAHKAAFDSLEVLKNAIDEGKSNKITRKNACLLPAQEKITSAKKDLVKAAMEADKTRNDVKMTINSREMIEKARKQFKEELESITPEIIIGDKNAKKLSEEQLNALLVHAYRRISQLQKQFANQVEFEMQRTQKSLEEQLVKNEIINAEHAKQLLDVQRAEFDVEKQNAIAETSLQYERQLVQELTRQTAAHAEHLKDVLATQEVDLEKKAELRLNAALIEERQSFQAEMAGWLARLLGIEKAVDGRAEQEKAARAAQDLWLACVTLKGAIARGNEEGYTWEDQLLPLTQQIIAIKKSAEGHRFVEAVLKSIPGEVHSRGVWKEDNLVKRFNAVKRNCKRVAMIDSEDDRTLFRFFLSYIQSYFIYPTAEAKTLEDEIDVENLDTFSCLVHADYWLKQGNLENALKFMNQLKGESRLVASDWIRETRLLLEMQQASRLLTAYASASGLGTIF